jgi:hypothetical protein
LCFKPWQNQDDIGIMLSQESNLGAWTTQGGCSRPRDTQKQGNGLMDLL